MKLFNLILILCAVYFFGCTDEEIGPAIIYTPAVVDIGSMVRISGKNFGHNYNAEVKFNGVPVEVYINRDDEFIDCIVPDNITPGKITITVNSETVESKDAYTVSNWKLLNWHWYGESWETPGLLCKRGNKLILRTAYSIMEFNIDTKAYIKITDLPFPLSEMPAEYYYIPYFIIGDNLYFQFEFSIERDFYEFNINTKVWTKKSIFPVEGSSYGKLGFSLAGKGYLLFGNLSEKKLWEYNPATNEWTNRADFPGPNRIYFAMYQSSDQLYVGAGYNNTAFKDRWKYDPVSNTWTQVEDFPGEGRYNPIVFSLNDGIYYGLGSKDDFYHFDPSLNSWSPFSIIFSNGYSNGMYAMTPTANHSYEGKGYLDDNGFIWEFNP